MAKKRQQIPRGAKTTQEIFSDPLTSKLTSSMLAKPDLDLSKNDFKNPYDAYSEAGFLGNLGKDIRKETKKIKNQDKIRTPKSSEKVNMDKTVNDFRKNSTTESTPLNEGFTHIPRLMGLLGQYVKPPSKVTFSEMYEASLDATLGSILQVAKSLIISKLGKYEHDDPKIQSIVRDTFGEVKESYFHYRALDFLIYGFSVGEISWGVNSKGYNYIDKTVFAPPTNIEFMVDDYGEMCAALQPNLVASQYGIFEGQSLNAPESVFAIRELIPSVLPYVLVEKENLFYVGYDSTFNPYGTSPMRRAYKYYQMKNLALEMFMAALSRNGAPTLTVHYQKDMIKNEEQIAQFKENVDSLAIGGVLYLPGRKGEAFEVEALRLDSSNIGIFLDFANYCDQMMVRSLGFPQEILLGSGGSYSSSNIQKETYEDMLQLYTDTYKTCLMGQIIKPIITTNFSSNYHKNNFGRFVPTLRESDRMEKMKQFELGVSSGLVDPRNREDVNYFRDSIGMEELKEGAKMPVDFVLENNISKTNTQGISKNPFNKQLGKPFSSSEIDK